MRTVEKIVTLASVTLLIAGASGCSSSTTVLYANGKLPAVQTLPFPGAHSRSTLFVANFDGQDVLLYPAAKNNPPPIGSRQTAGSVWRLESEFLLCRLE